MRHISLPFIILFLMMACATREIGSEDKDGQVPRITLVIHGGAGTIRKENITDQQEKAYHAVLKQALEAGYDVLIKGGKSADAVVAAITLLEDSPLFNAGKGAVFTHAGKNELDASIMDGSNLKAGAIAGVTTIKNPIKAAYEIMANSEHVMLAGKGAEEFAKGVGLQMVHPGYFIDSARYQQYLKRREADTSKDGASLLKEIPNKFGTVGAVALDKSGNLAAGTSTGGMSDKKFGRVGDSPIIGAGTYANNKTCGISSTGWGEYFIRLAVAHDISAMMEYAGLSLDQAADSVIMKKLPALGGDGGIIGLDRDGNISMKFNTEGMYRGYINAPGEAKTFIFKDDSN